MKHKQDRRSERTFYVAVALVLLTCLSGSAVIAQKPFTYEHVIGTGDPTPADPHKPKVDMDKIIAACDIGLLTEFGLMSNVCSFDGDPNSNGGVYHPIDGDPYRSFRREDPLPGQKVGFEKAVIPFGFPVLHPTTGDTYLTAFFDPEGNGHSNLPGGQEEGVYVYGFVSNTMEVIADTTTGSGLLPTGAVWTDFSTNVAVSEAGAFFVGDYKESDGTARQGVYRYFKDQLSKIVGDPASTNVPGEAMKFARYRGVAANGSTVIFVGESQPCARNGRSEDCLVGVYAYHLDVGRLSKVIESGADVPGGGTFRDFAVEPEAGIFHSSIAVNQVGNIVLVAGYENQGKSFQGVFLLRRSGSDYTPVPILRSGITDDSLLKEAEIQSFNTVTINDRSEIAFVVANTDEVPIKQGLVFYRDAVEGLRSVFKQGDTFLADLKHSGVETVDHGALVSGSQSLDSSSPPRIFFRHFYKVKTETEEVGHSMMVLATLYQ